VGSDQARADPDQDGADHPSGRAGAAGPTRPTGPGGLVEQPLPVVVGEGFDQGAHHPDTVAPNQD
jgi:hypothetical protein